MKLKNTVLTLAILLLTYILMSNEFKVNAWNATNKTAFSMGGKYSNIDTTSDAETAYNYYNDMNLTYNKIITKPLPSSVKGNHPNGIKYLNSGIVFLAGHGGKTNMCFESEDSDMFFLTKGTSDYSKNIGIGNYVNSLNAMIVFAGCETSKENDNIAAYAYEKGAKISVGWNTEVKDGSLKNWLSRFNKKIKDKSTSARDAMKYADGFIYLDSRVKNGYIYGFKNYNPWYFMNGGNASKSILKGNMKELKNNLNDNEYILETEKGDDKFSKSLTKFVKNKLNREFNIDEYVLEINGSDIKYYDYIFYVNNIRTEYGYTIAVDENNNITVYDNFQKLSENSLKKRILSKKDKIENSYTKFKSDIDSSVYKMYTKNEIKMDNSFLFYNSIDDKLYYISSYIIKFSNQTKSIVDYWEEV